MNLTNSITVRVLKYDGIEHRRWLARVQRQEGPLLILDARFDTEINHNLIGKIATGTISTEYYWLDRWYNVFRFSAPDGRLLRYYCNVNMPPVFDGSVLSYVDLDIDILVQADMSYRVLDRDDFESNAASYSYSSEVRRNVDQALDELVALVTSRDFPFDQ